MESLQERNNQLMVFFHKRIEYSLPYKTYSFLQKHVSNNKYIACYFFILILWIVHFLVLSGALQKYGLLPRSFKGFLGIFTFSFFHANFSHLASNSIALALFLPAFIFVRRANIFSCLFLMVLIKGCLIWFLGRNAHLIGASGLVYSIWGYLIFNGILSKDLAKVFLSIALLFPTAFMFKGMNPMYVGRQVSFEGHFFGMVAGIIVAWICFDRVKHDWINLEAEVPLTYVEAKAEG
jgi:membrane associated rhomboid family serine protease